MKSQYVTLILNTCLLATGVAKGDRKKQKNHPSLLGIHSSKARGEHKLLWYKIELIIIALQAKVKKMWKFTERIE